MAKALEKIFAKGSGTVDLANNIIIYSNNTVFWLSLEITIDRVPVWIKL
ncbi:MAG: hypothetical protein M1496_03995 [Candidatus Thermoplasmatota archaeon]|nr:hypothetical protein [Candidatus Thermoplasmatota archaeon]